MTKDDALLLLKYAFDAFVGFTPTDQQLTYCIDDWYKEAFNYKDIND